MKKVFVTRNIHQQGIDLLKDKGYEVHIWQKDRPMKKKELIKHLSKRPYDAILSLLTDTVDKEIFESCPSIKVVSNYAVGFNNIDIEEAKKRNIAVFNTAITMDSVAQHTIALILSLTNRIVESNNFVKKGKYNGWSPNIFWWSEMKGKTLGLVGTGRIGERVAYFANKGFETKVIYFDLNENKHIENDCGAKKVSSIEELLKEADIVSLHVPLLESTHHLIDSKRLSLMKKNAILINTSRGPVVDEQALFVALKNKDLAGAGLDVFEFEPKITKGLTKLENVILTPHIASATEKSRIDMAILAAKNIVDKLG